MYAYRTHPVGAHNICALRAYSGVAVGQGMCIGAVQNLVVSLRYATRKLVVPLAVKGHVLSQMKQ